MAELDINKLLKTLDNDDNAYILKLNYTLIEKQKKQILSQLHLDTESYTNINNKLKDYRFIDELPDMIYGSYIRWISIKHVEPIKLVIGGIVCEMKVEDAGIIIVCKNRFNRFFQFNMNDVLVFKKLSEQEKVVLTAIATLTTI